MGGRQHLLGRGGSSSKNVVIRRGGDWVRKHIKNDGWQGLAKPQSYFFPPLPFPHQMMDARSLTSSKGHDTYGKRENRRNPMIGTGIVAVHSGCVCVMKITRHSSVC